MALNPWLILSTSLQYFRAHYIKALRHSISDARADNLSFDLNLDWAKPNVRFSLIPELEMMGGIAEKKKMTLGRKKHRNTETPKHRNTATPKHQNTKTPKHRNTKTPKHRNAETPKHRTQLKILSLLNKITEMVREWKLQMTLKKWTKMPRNWTHEGQS